MVLITNLACIREQNSVNVTTIEILASIMQNAIRQKIYKISHVFSLCTFASFVCYDLIESDNAHRGFVKCIVILVCDLPLGGGDKSSVLDSEKG